MAHNNAWANRRLLDRFYVDAMEGGMLGPAAWSDPQPCATVAALHEAPPPQLDEFFCAGEESLRTREFAAPGWTERAVWSER